MISCMSQDAFGQSQKQPLNREELYHCASCDLSLVTCDMQNPFSMHTKLHMFHLVIYYSACKSLGTLVKISVTVNN